MEQVAPLTSTNSSATPSQRDPHQAPPRTHGAPLPTGQQWVMFQSESNVANGTVITIDTSLDWRDRVLYGWVLAYGAATYPATRTTPT